MKVVPLLLACAALAAARPQEKRFLLDTLFNELDHVAHFFIDPVVETVGFLVNGFTHAVDGHVDIHTVACRLSTTGATRDEKINSCIRQCISNGATLLGEASGSAAQACPLACQFVVDHPDQMVCSSVVQVA